MKRRPKQVQESFVTILEDSFRAHERKMVSYMLASKDAHLSAARFITPNLGDKEAVFARIAFAILSANAPFADAVSALNYVVENRGKVRGIDLAQWRMVPAKANYCNEAWQSIMEDGTYYQRYPEEEWSDYRYRLQGLFRGLGIAKASFAACLLYPLDADLACIDTWMQKVFCGNTGFKQLGKAKYEAIEAKVRTYARKIGVSTFVAQWLIWDHARGGKVNEHAIFPGSHKGAE